jgi:hypothetical protein
MFGFEDEAEIQGKLVFWWCLVGRYGDDSIPIK